MTIFDDIRNDRADGTAGPWTYSEDPEGLYENKISIHTEDEFYICLVDECTSQEANARRIARVPQLEAIALAVSDALQLADAGMTDDAINCIRKAANNHCIAKVLK